MNDAHELFDLPDGLRNFLERAGYRCRLAVIARVDGKALTEYDRRTMPALVRVAEPNGAEGDSVPASEAFIRTADGSVEWTPEARKVLDAQGIPRSPAKAGANTKSKGRRKAAKRRAR